MSDGVSGSRARALARHRAMAAAAPNIVMLSASTLWTAAATEQARELGVGPIHTANSPQEAIALVAGGSPPVSHLLLQPHSAGDLLPDLVEMTAGQETGASLVVLGEPEALPVHPSAQAMTFVLSPSHGWLQRVLVPEAGGAKQQEALPHPSMTELQEALTHGRIQTRYQPIVRLDTGQPVGLEVLARLEHPDRGILAPDLFVPQMEEGGLAWALTEAVITRAFADWDDGRLGSYGLTLALNFPLDVLLIPDALTKLETRRRQSGLPPERVVIELTESRPVTELARLRHAIATLRGMGYGLAIDDVGPELRDHMDLLDMQFTALKLDKDLVQESIRSGEAHQFLTATIASARKADLSIIAEGVENQAIWDEMQRLGVNEAQGFMVARPLPAAAVPIWYRDWATRLER